MAKASTTAADPFSTATVDFTGLKDLAGRAVLVYPTAIEKDIPSTMPGGESKTYDRIVADVIVLDGDPDPDIDVHELPTTFDDMFISGAAVVPQLRGALKHKRPVLGIVTLRPARDKRYQPAPVLDGEAVTDAQKALARKAWAEYEASQPDPFDTGKGE